MLQDCLWGDAAQLGLTVKPSISLALIHRVEPSSEVEHVAVIGSRLHVVSTVFKAQVRLTTHLVCLLSRPSKQIYLCLFHLIVDALTGLFGDLGRKDT